MIDADYTKIVLIWLIAAIVSAELIMHGLPLARYLGFVHIPKGDRWNARVVPMGGGLVIVFTTIVLAVLSLKGGGLDLAGAVALLCLTGLVDDKYTLSPRIKLAIQLAVATFLAYRGYRFNFLSLPFSILISVFWMVGISNAINLLDNMDGIAGGISTVALLGVAAPSVFSGGSDTGVVFAAAASGAAAGFMVHNIHPALVFMGDAGSLPLGLILAASATAIKMPTAWPQGTHVALSALIAAVPIFDTTLVCISRLRARRSISTGGRDHTTHRLVKIGLSERRTALVLYAFTACTSALAWISLATRPLVLLASLIAVFGVGMVALVRLLRLQVYESAPAAKILSLKKLKPTTKCAKPVSGVASRRRAK